MFESEDDYFSLNELLFSKRTSSLQIKPTLAKYSPHIGAFFHIGFTSFEDFIMGTGRSSDDEDLRSRYHIFRLVRNLVKLSDKISLLFPRRYISLSYDLCVPVSGTTR